MEQDSVEEEMSRATSSWSFNVAEFGDELRTPVTGQAQFVSLIYSVAESHGFPSLLARQRSRIPSLSSYCVRSAVATISTSLLQVSNLCGEVLDSRGDDVYLWWVRGWVVVGVFGRCGVGVWGCGWGGVHGWSVRSAVEWSGVGGGVARDTLRPTCSSRPLSEALNAGGQLTDSWHPAVRAGRYKLPDDEHRTPV